MNTRLLKVFGPVLVVVGVLGFVTPPELALTSGALPYNVFHIGFGLLGIGCAWSGRIAASRAFNFSFGLIDLYQAVASLGGLWPRELFVWKAADDVLHVVIGLLLVFVAVRFDGQRAATA